MIGIAVQAPLRPRTSGSFLSRDAWPGLSTARPVGGCQLALSRYGAAMTQTLVDRLAARAMALTVDAFDDAAIAELRGLAAGDDQALEQAIRACLAQPAPLAIRHRAIELLARVRYEDPPPPA